MAGVPIRVSYDAAERSVRIVNRTTGESLPVVKAYWFAWQAFYPETRLWSGPEPRRKTPADASLSNP